MAGNYNKGGRGSSNSGNRSGGNRGGGGGGGNKIAGMVAVRYESQAKADLKIKGRIMNDPKGKELDNGSYLIGFNVSQHVGKRGEENIYENFRVTFWGQAAKEVAQVATKGMSCSVYGLRGGMSVFTPEDGEPLPSANLTGLIFYMGSEEGENNFGGGNRGGNGSSKSRNGSGKGDRPAWGRDQDEEPEDEDYDEDDDAEEPEDEGDDEEEAPKPSGKPRPTNRATPPRRPRR